MMSPVIIGQFLRAAFLLFQMLTLKLSIEFTQRGNKKKITQVQIMISHVIPGDSIH